MRKSCLVQLILLVLVVLVVALGARRFLGDRRDDAGTASAVPETVEESGQSFTGRIGALVMQRPTSAPTDATPPEPSGIEGLALQISRPLVLDIARIQGLAIDERFVYVSGFDPGERTAFVFQMGRDTGTIAQVRQVTQGGRFQVGGAHCHEGQVWAPIAGESEQAGSIILALDTSTLAPAIRFEVRDYIAAVAHLDGSVFGVNDDSTIMYQWDVEGREQRRVALATGARYQDMETANGSLVCAGVSPQGGVLDILDPESLSLLTRHMCSARARNGQLVTSRGFAYWEGAFFFMPTAGDWPHLVSYALQGTTLQDYIPRAQR